MNLRAIGFHTFIEDDERVEKVFRRPVFFVLWKLLLRTVIWGGMAYGLYYFYPQIIKLWLAASAWAAYQLSAAFLFWYVNGIVMTNQNLIFIAWPSLFKRKASTLEFWGFDQIETERTGISSFLVNFGTLRFYKAGEQVYELIHVARPNYTAKAIDQHRERTLDHKNFTEESALKDLLSQMVETHVDKNGQPVREYNPNAKKFSYNSATPPGAPEPVAGEKPKKSFFQKRTVSAQTEPPKVEHHFQSENIEIEKKLDDTGGIEIDLEQG